MEVELEVMEAVEAAETATADMMEAEAAVAGADTAAKTAAMEEGVEARVGVAPELYMEDPEIT